MKIPNALIHATSPYLLQHAYNPVQWYPWGEEALHKAAVENKLLIISIGYSACHWCHVMEKECFEDEEVATVMNKSFVCIKVDREERPDIDQVYMDALLLMTGQGGWPLNVISLPDQRPLYGGTYFPKEKWREVLLQLAAFYRNDPLKCAEYAAELSEGMNKISGKITVAEEESGLFPDHADILERWGKFWDREEGGPLRAPKFPMPDSYRYLLAASHWLKLPDGVNQVKLTLRKMAFGGIYDQIGGGFARYSTDMQWKVPHFEKMLYDNALLISLYADAYKLTGDPLFKEVAGQTWSFVLRELTSPLNGFYTALDADSEGQEGKYYCWTLSEVQEVTGDDFKLACDYFNFNEHGFWEHNSYIPLRYEEDLVLRERYALSETDFRNSVEAIRVKLLERRQSRVKPGLDDKILCSWNALMISACVDAYTAFGETKYLNQALLSVAFLKSAFMKAEYHLMHAAKEQNGTVASTVTGFLEDYAFVIEAFISLYAVTMNEVFLQDAAGLTGTVLKEFRNEATGLCWFTSSTSEKLIVRKQEVQDDVIPSSNAVMAHNLLRLSRINTDLSMEEQCRRMLVHMKQDTLTSASWYSRWARVFLEFEHGSEVAICGANAREILKEMNSGYLPLSIFAAASGDSEVPLLKGRLKEHQTLVYVCRYHSCHQPVKSASEAIDLLNG